MFGTGFAHGGRVRYRYAHRGHVFCTGYDYGDVRARQVYWYGGHMSGAGKGTTVHEKPPNFNHNAFDVFFLFVNEIFRHVHESFLGDMNGWLLCTQYVYSCQEWLTSCS